MKEAGFTYLEFVNTIDDIDQNAKIIFKAGEVEQPAVYENKSIRIEGLTPEGSYDISVTITGDENYNDLTNATYIKNAITKAIPSERWDNHADESWYNSEDKTFKINTAAQLAGVSKIVCDGNDMSGKTIIIDADIDMSEYMWIPIGACGRFRGTINGNYHKLTGLVSSDMDYEGLVGYADKAGIYNIYVDNSYFGNGKYAGGIVGRLDNATVSNCVSHAVVDDGEYNGGIVGLSKCGGIYRAENFGKVAAYRYVGGIVGWSDCTRTQNCVNFGLVYGKKVFPYCGGIVGCANNNDFIYNCYNTGTVTGGLAKSGAILGCANNNGFLSKEGTTMEQCYYLSGCAGSKGACGTGNNGIKSNKTASFSGPNVAMDDNCEENTIGKTLVEKLNVWTNRVEGQTVWEIKEGNDYPTIIGMP